MEQYLNTIQNCDCLEFMKTLPDKCIDLVLTDIPYDMVNRESSGLRNLDKKDADIMNIPLNILLKEIMRICKGSIYIFCGFGQISEIATTFKNNEINPRLIIWEKTNPSPMNGEVTWLSGVEPCVYAKFPKAVFNGHCRNTVLRFPSGKSTDHPTEKNISLFSDLISTSSNENDIVFDPFLGSGTTALACKNLKRNYIGCEISKEYCDIAQKRLNACTQLLF